MFANVNPRPAKGGWSNPLRFFKDSVKTAAHSAAKFDIAYGTVFLQKNCSKWPQIRSPGHKKRYNIMSKFQLYLCTRPNHSFWPISFQLSGCASFTEMYNISSDFLYCYLEVSGRSWLCNAKPMGKNIQIAPIPKKLEIAVQSHQLCASIPHYVTIRD